jgi:propanol-preferring alcohol dehydrogenase
MKAWEISKTVDLSIETGNENISPLQRVDVPIPEPREGEVLVKVKACGICHTEVDEIEGRTPPPRYPIIPGHQVIGTIEKTKGHRSDISADDRVGIAWIYDSCGECDYCLSGQENLCAGFIATGRDAHGGYAEYMVVPEKSVFKIPSVFSDMEAAPLLCAGAIGYRSLLLCNLLNGQKLALTGFGASAHLVVKLARYLYPDSEIYAFARSMAEREFALSLGCTWAGDTEDAPPQLPDCIIDTTPVWKPVIKALEYLKPGGRLVINAIRKENIDQEELLSLNYPKHIWMEKEIKSVANITRKDVENFLRIAGDIPLKPDIEEYSFDQANRAILEIKQRKIRGAKVLVI